MPDAVGRHRPITPAEARVLVLLLERLTPRDAAEKLGSSVLTVRTHIKHLQAKSDTHTIAALVLWGPDELTAGEVQRALDADPRWCARARLLLTNR
jgi:DNA-binding CsgD family transcriptional regulator